MRKKPKRLLKRNEIARWKHLGLVETPRSNKQGSLAIDARNFIQALACFGEVKRLLALGRKSTDVRKFIVDEKGEGGTTSPSTVQKYCQMYRRFFLTPIDFLRAKSQVDVKADGGVRTIVSNKLSLLHDGFEEIQNLEKLAALHWTRIERAELKERDLAGFLFPGLEKEFAVLRDTWVKITELKMDLGTYMRVPQRMLVGAKVQHVGTGNLTPNEKQALIEFGGMFVEMVELTRKDPPVD